VIASLGALAGGIGLFLLGMWMMTEGLKLAAGAALQRILARSTGTRLRGLGTGMLVTALVQSSSAVTVAAIGFVNAGLLTLSQAIWVLFGANVGTTMTGWIVASVGLGFKIESAALPLIGLGMFLHLSAPGRRRGAVGMVLAGFGTLFFGIDLLQDSFGDLGESVALPPSEGGPGSVVSFVLVGLVLTVLMQSSSAALALTLTAAHSGMLHLFDAAAMVIGANLGTTVTALIAAFGATSNAKRAAGAHVLFNLVTGVVALFLLPGLLWSIGSVAALLDQPVGAATTLAMFHTIFNVLGVLIMWPLGNRLADFLALRFRTLEEDEARPRYLDENAVTVPEFALGALEQETRRLGEITSRMAAAVLRMPGAASADTSRDKKIAERLNQAIGEFIARVNASQMVPECARRLPWILRARQYFRTAAEEAHELALLELPSPTELPAELAAAMAVFLMDVRLLAGLPGVPDTSPIAGGQSPMAAGALEQLESSYQPLKARLLDAGAAGQLSVPAMELLLRFTSLSRRLGTQLIKARAALAGQLAAQINGSIHSSLPDGASS